MIDIGMNVANNTMEYSTWAKTVHGFEPFPSTYELAEANILLNKNVELKGRYWDYNTETALHQPDYKAGWHKLLDKSFSSLKIIADIHTHNIALGDRVEDIEMEDHPNNAGHNCVLAEDRREKTKYNLVKTTMTTLDSYNFTDVDAIKIDCEGYEYPVLQGAINTIQTNRPVVQLEIVEKQCKQFGYTPQDLFDFFQDTVKGYVTTDFNGNDLGTDWRRIKGVMDRFFVPEEVYKQVPKTTKQVRHSCMAKAQPDKNVFDKLFE
jgi:FkbM family methyltransferase